MKAVEGVSNHTTARLSKTLRPFVEVRISRVHFVKTHSGQSDRKRLIVKRIRTESERNMSRMIDEDAARIASNELEELRNILWRSSNPTLTGWVKRLERIQSLLTGPARPIVHPPTCPTNPPIGNGS